MKLCITTLVDENYVAYIPMFSWCCKKAYPEYDIKLFVRGEGRYAPGAKVIHNFFKDYPQHGPNTIALRFAIPGEHYKEYDYVYITDIDIMIIRESPTLLDFHLKEMQMTGLCYSNSIRNSKHWQGANSLTGLHFCSKKWFEKTEGQAENFRKYLKVAEVRREYDGHMLAIMAENTRIGKPGKFRLATRHHGIHLGNFRLMKKLKKLKVRMPRNFCAAWKGYLSDPEFSEICTRARQESSMIDRQLTKLDELCKRMLV